MIVGGDDGPKVGTSVKSETNGRPAEASVDVIIITGDCLFHFAVSVTLIACTTSG